MLYALVFACCTINANACLTMVGGPYATMEECQKRLTEIATGIGGTYRAVSGKCEIR